MLKNVPSRLCQGHRVKCRNVLIKTWKSDFSLSPGRKRKIQELDERPNLDSSHTSHSRVMEERTRLSGPWRNGKNRETRQNTPRGPNAYTQDPVGCRSVLIIRRSTAPGSNGSGARFSPTEISGKQQTVSRPFCL